MKKLLILAFIVLPILNTNALNLDSLWTIWNSPTQADTVKLEAIGIIAWSGYLFSKPDSAYYFAQLQYEYAKKTNNLFYTAAALNTQGATFWIQNKYNKAITNYSNKY